MCMCVCVYIYRKSQNEIHTAGARPLRQYFWKEKKINKMKAAILI